MVLVGLSAAAITKWVLRIQWRWIGCGALLWAIAFAEKFGLDCSLNGPALNALQKHLPNPLYLALGSSYIGLQTGYTEVVVTLVAGLLWRRLAFDVRRAIGIGLGAGAFEAVYFGLMAIVAIGEISSAQAGFGVSAFVPAVERLIVIPCHAAVRAMTLYTVATGRWSWFWGGFVMFSVMDGIAGYYHLSNTVHTINPWLIELSFLSFPLISILLLQYLWRHWPTTTRQGGDLIRKSQESC